MQQLPFLVVHGAIVWKVALVVFSGLTLGAILGAYYLLARRDVRRRVPTPAVPGPVILRGTLHGMLETANGVDRQTEATWIEHELGRIEIDDKVRVERGTADKLPQQQLLIDSVQRLVEGDAVILRGTLARKNDQWIIESSAPKAAWDRLIFAVAAQAPIRHYPRIWKIAIAALAITVGWFAALHHIGARHWSETLSAALPASRTEALGRYDEELEHAQFPTETKLHLRAGLSELQSGCPIELYRKVMRFDDELAVARRCGTHADVVQALLEAGKYEDAARELSPTDNSYDAAIIYIATGRWLDAARTLEANAHEYGVRYSCLAATMRTWAGQRDAFHSINADCDFYRALALPLDQQQAAMNLVNYNALELWETVVFTSLFSKRASVSVFPESDLESTLWFVPFMQLDDYYKGSALAAFDIQNGDFASARVRLGHETDEFPRQSAAELLAQRSGATPATSDDAHWAQLRRGETVEHVDFDLAIGDPKLTLEVMTAAQGGDGRPAATALRSDNMYRRWPHILIGVLPLVKTHRADLADAIRSHREYEQFPFGYFSTLSLYRDVSRLIGDDEEADRLQTIFKRHAAVLADRNKLIALRLWAD